MDRRDKAALDNNAKLRNPNNHIANDNKGVQQNPNNPKFLPVEKQQLQPKKY